MPHRSYLLLLLCLAWTGAFAIDGPLGQTQRAWAQDSSRSSKSDGESREERRERFKRMFGGDRGGDNGRDSHGDRPRGDEGRHGTSNSKSTTKSASPSLSTSEYAKTFIIEHDKNGNHWLDGDELKDLRGKPAEADLNKDGVITVEELTTRLSSDGPTSPASGGGSNSGGGSESSGQHHRDGDNHSKSDSDNAAAQRVFTGSAGGLASITKEGDKRHSYRFTPASERLPSGLPPWFKSDDVNGDGQVSMSEYARSWSERTASEFRQIDANGDGVITAKEAAKKPAAGG